MPQIDLPLDQLRAYRSDLDAPADLRAFWSDTLADAARHELSPSFDRVDSGLAAVETYDMAFNGFGGQPIRGWLPLPAAGVRTAGPLPTVVQFQGYNGGRGLAHEYVFWACAG